MYLERATVDGEDHAGMWLCKTVVSCHCQRWCAQRGRGPPVQIRQEEGLGGAGVAHGLSERPDSLLFPVAERS